MGTAVYVRRAHYKIWGKGVWDRGEINRKTSEEFR